jgi:hypothetical protein
MGHDLLSDARRAALVVAHPGHELRIHGWVERARPVVFVLTDGSGAAGQSRLHCTTRVIERACARTGEIYGALTDRELYTAILGHESSVFVQLAARLFDAIIREKLDLLVSDAPEGFSPAHDLCYYLADAAAARARLEGREIASFVFPLEGPPAVPIESLPPGCIHIEHSEDSFVRKLTAARSYIGMEEEVRRALSTHSEHAFRREVLWPAGTDFSLRSQRTNYEIIGEQRRAKGTYKEVIRRREHIDPLICSLRRFVAEARDSATHARTLVTE